VTDTPTPKTSRRNVLLGIGGAAVFTAAGGGIGYAIADNDDKPDTPSQPAQAGPA
jgi:hypothetical protein